MTSSIIRFAPIMCYSVLPDGSVTKPIPVAKRYVSVERTDTARRRRPVGFALLTQSTPAYTCVTESLDQAFSYWSGRTEINTCVGQKGSIGYGGETLPPAEDIVRNKLLSQARSMTVNLANTLGEYQQCARMFASAAKSFVGLLGVLHSRNPWVIKRYLFSGSTTGFGKIVSKRILEFQYGVKPLISDVNGSIKALKKRADAKPIFVRVSAKHSDYFYKVYPGPDPTMPLTGRADQVVTKLEVITRGWAAVTLNRDVLNRTLGQFGFTNPLSLAYELTPFSFVLDWFFNVGEFLLSLDNSLYFESSICQFTRREKYSRECRLGNAVGTYRFTKISRGSSRSLGSVADIRFKPGISSTHIVNGLALITQALTNIRRR